LQEYCYEAIQDPTLILLVVCAVAALGTGIAIEGPETVTLTKKNKIK
jgi:hypothetical protein